MPLLDLARDAIYRYAPYDGRANIYLYKWLPAVLRRSILFVLHV